MLIRFFFIVALFFSVGSPIVSAQGEAGAPADQTPKTISGGVLNGKATNLVKPPYPAAAKAVRASGAVNVQVTIDESGNVISASAVSGHPLLRASAVQAARASKFSPTMLAGQAVKVTGVIVYNFVLPKETESRDSVRLLPIGITMFLAAMKDLPGDEESAQILRDMGSTIPAGIKAEKSQFDRLASARSADEKSRIVDEIIASMREGASETDAWMIDFGRNWGGAIGEAYKISDSDFRRDRKDLIKSLEAMNWLLESPPKEISAELIGKIRTVASYNNETDRITPEFIRNFLKTSLDFMQFMVDEGKRGND